MSTSEPFCISITGADNEVAPSDLRALQQRFPLVEWAVLLLPEKEGQPRNPTAAWREQFLECCGGAKTALHLCGTQVFREILAGSVPAEFARYGRVQVNINARRPEFTDAEVAAVYTALLDSGHRLILQCHEATEALIIQFVQGLRSTPYADQVDVLFDASRGKGLSPSAWPAGYQFRPAPVVVTPAGWARTMSPVIWPR